MRRSGGGSSTASSISETMGLLNAQGVTAPRNRANVLRAGPHAMGGGGPIEMIAIKLVSQASGLFVVSFDIGSNAAATTSLTWQVNTYTNASPNVPITLQTNAQAVGVNCYIDNTGAGIPPASGATAAAIAALQNIVVGSAGPDYNFNWSGQIGHGPSGATANVAPTPVPNGQTLYVTVSLQVNASEIGYSFVGSTASAYELP